MGGTAKVTNDGEIKLLTEGRRYMSHWVQNINGEHGMILIEVQIGNYLGEDDIVRYEGIYEISGVVEW